MKYCTGDAESPTNPDLFQRRTGHLVHDLSVLKQDKRRNSAHIVLARRVLIIININFAKVNMSIGLGQSFKLRRDHFARTAPTGGEVHYRELVRRDHFVDIAGDVI